MSLVSLFLSLSQAVNLFNRNMEPLLHPVPWLVITSRLCFIQRVPDFVRSELHCCHIFMIPWEMTDSYYTLIWQGWYCVMQQQSSPVPELVSGGLFFFFLWFNAIVGAVLTGSCEQNTVSWEKSTLTRFISTKPHFFLWNCRWIFMLYMDFSIKILIGVDWRPCSNREQMWSEITKS